METLAIVNGSALPRARPVVEVSGLPVDIGSVARILCREEREKFPVLRI